MYRYTRRTGVLEVVMFLVALVFMIPIYVLVNLSIRPQSDLSSPLAPTMSPVFTNFADAWAQSNLGVAMMWSGVITVATVLLLVATGSLAAYSIARVTNRWGSVAFYLFMIGLLVPFQLGLVPLYKNLASMGIIGTPLPLILIYLGLRLPFTVFLYTSFLRQVPIDYEEAAHIDGAGPVRTFRSVVFPLMRPITGTVIILNGLFTWNDFLMPLLYLSGTKFQTVPLAIYGFVNENTTNWPLVFAALLLSVVPVLILFFIFQKTLIQGFASGIKG